MRNPFRTLRSFVSDNARRVRDAARSAVEQLGPDSGRDDPEESPADNSPGAHGSRGSPEEFEAQQPDARPETNREDEDRFQGGERDDQTQQAEETVGVMFDRQPRSIRTIRPVDEGQTDGSTHREHRHVFVTTGEWKGEEQQNAQASPDVVLDVSRLEVDELSLQVEQLEAEVALQAKISELVDISVGANVQLGCVDLDIEDVRAEALLETHLEEIRLVIERALKTLEERPELVTETVEKAGDIAGDARQISEGVADVADEAGDAADLGGETSRDSEQSSQEGVTGQLDAADDLRAHADDLTEQGVANPSIEAESKAEYESGNEGESQS